MFTPDIVRFFKYSAVGVATFLFDLVLLYVLTSIFEVGYLVAAGSAFLFAVSINYVISRRFVFTGTDRGIKSGYVNFILIALAGLSIVLSGMYIFVEYFNLPMMLSRIILSGVTGFWNYTMNLTVNFKVAGKHF